MKVVARTRETRKPHSHDGMPVLCGLECLMKDLGVSHSLARLTIANHRTYAVLRCIADVRAGVEPQHAACQVYRACSNNMKD
jgi:hypothetical protein